MKKIICGALLAGSFIAPAFAGPAEYIYMPKVEYGEREIDIKYGSRKMSGGDLSAASIGLGFGLTEYWFSEVYVKYNRANDTTSLDAYEWENKFQLTETGQYPIDVGMLLEIERPQDRTEGYEVTFGPLLQTEFDKLQLNANLLFTRNYRADASNIMQTKYQVQAKYRLKKEFAFGMQGFGELGDYNHWSSVGDQTHRFGPAIFGKFAIGNRQAIKYNTAYLIGKTANGDNLNKDSQTLRLQLEYEF
jgi:hypothetical protein